MPYDFDYSGLVNAPYAVPCRGSSSLDVTDRVFLGPCRDVEKMEANFQFFQSKKAAILEACDAFEMFNSGTRKQVRKYIESFFAILDDPEKTRKEILEKCGK